MKPPPFAYHRPGSREEVDRLLGELGEDAKVLAGGQSLVPILNMRLAAPGHLVDVNRLRDDEPEEPVQEDGHIAVGPLVRHAALERSALVAERLPVLRETIRYVAHPAIRSRGTVVGSIAHADPAAELPAALAALGGEAAVRSASGRRTIPAAELFVSHLETSLVAGEWIEAVRFPAGDFADGHAVEEFSRRHGDYAVCGVIAVARRERDERATVALAFISMAAVPERIELPPLGAAEIEGGALDEAVAAVVDERLDPAPDLHATVEYRAALGRRLGARAVRRAARMALEGAR